MTVATTPTVEELQAIVDKLPKTVDGISVTPGMRVFCVWPGQDWISREIAYIGPSPASMYSTRAAAEAERGKNDG